MSRRFNVSQAKDVPGREKPIWLRHGVAFEKDGKISIKLESLPLPNGEGEIWLKLFEDAGERGKAPSGSTDPWAPSSGAVAPPTAAPDVSSSSGTESLDDQIPF